MIKGVNAFEPQTLFIDRDLGLKVCIKVLLSEGHTVALAHQGIDRG